MARSEPTERDESVDDSLVAEAVAGRGGRGSDGRKPPFYGSASFLLAAASGLRLNLAESLSSAVCALCRS
jgi:hypothetical protein